MNGILLRAVPLFLLAAMLAWEALSPQAEPGLSAALPDAPAGVPGHVDGLARRPDGSREAAAVVIRRPLFTEKRRPFEAPTAPPVANANHDQGLPRLSGVVIGPEERRAIFVDAAGHVRTATEGMAIGAFIIRAISPARVTVSSASGERVLQPTFPKTEASVESAAPASSQSVPAYPAEGRR